MSYTYIRKPSPHIHVIGICLYIYGWHSVSEFSKTFRKKSIYTVQMTRGTKVLREQHR